jgi:hypothetical protein
MRRQDDDTKALQQRQRLTFPPKVCSIYILAGLLTLPFFSSLPICNWQTVASIAENNIRLSIGITATGIVPGLHRIPF